MNIGGNISAEGTIGGSVLQARSVTVSELYFSNRYEFPDTGEPDKLYIAEDENAVYRFDGEENIYVRLAASPDVSGLGNLFTLKGRADGVSDLPQSDVNAGDVYLVGEEDASEYQEYYWTGAAWDFMGKTASIDLSDYYLKSEADALFDSCVKKDEKLILNCVLEADK